jgi:hypothetical protein
MPQCEVLDLPSYARITVDHLDEPLDPQLRVKHVLRVELPHSIRIDVNWDWESGGYWVSAWHPMNGDIEELALRWSHDTEALARAVETLARQVS